MSLSQSDPAGSRKCGVMGNFVVEIQPAEPAIAKMQLNFLASGVLTHAKAITDNQHPDQEFRID